MRRQLSQAAFVGGYFILLLGYLFWYQEPELLHWVTLVILPLVGLYVIGRYPSRRMLLESVGLGNGRATRGAMWVAVFGLAFSALQFLNTQQRAEFVSLLREPFGFLLPIGALVLLLGTAATTEEVFFRGVLQSRLADLLRNEPATLLIAAGAFTLYHLPYAYLKPSWPSAGDFPRALQLAVATGVPTGLALGIVYWRSGRNLVACIALHAIIDLVPATRLVHRLLG